VRGRIRGRIRWETSRTEAFSDGVFAIAVLAAFRARPDSTTAASGQPAIPAD
jgi:hypothetical protein